MRNVLKTADGKIRLLHNRVRFDIERELRDTAELERQLVRSLHVLQATKRQLEIKRDEERR